MSEQTVTTDVVVIGAGVIGCDVAYELARRGRRVTVVDRGPGAGHGSTSASSACIRFNYSTFTAVAVAWEAKQLWAEWEGYLEGTDDGQLARFVQTGALCLESPGQQRSKVLSFFDRAGVPYEEWDSDAVRTRLPALDPGRFWPPKRVTDEAFWDPADGTLTAYWTPDGGFVDDPVFAAHNLMTAAVRKGAEFRFRAQVAAIIRDERSVRGVELADGTTIVAPVVINVSGPHSGVINEMAGVLDDFSVGTRPMRQEVHHLAAPRDWNHEVPGPMVADLDLGTYFRGAPAGGLLVGGAEPECDELQWLDDADRYAGSVTKEVYEAQAYRAARRLSELAVPNRPSGVVGVYDVSDDWVPIYDRTSLAGYYVAIGTSGNQFKNAPVVGQLLAAIIEATEAGEDHDRVPTRVTLPVTGLTVDLSDYSRLRPVDRTRSSFSVFA
jgi:sarcosine oxidase subunit beta